MKASEFITEDDSIDPTELLERKWYSTMAKTMSRMSDGHMLVLYKKLEPLLNERRSDLIEYIENLLSKSLQRLNDVRSDSRVRDQFYYLRDMASILHQFGRLTTTWSNISSSFAKRIDVNKTQMMYLILTYYKTMSKNSNTAASYHRDSNEFIKNLIIDLKALGINWPELDTIVSSVNYSKSVSTQLDEDSSIDRLYKTLFDYLRLG
jgi:hypothetical protein